MTVLAKFIAGETDVEDYSVYVFQILDKQAVEMNHTNYIMCVRFPNWVQDPFELGDEGYLNIKSVQGGIDEWYDGTSMVKYRYSNDIFVKFIKKQPETPKEILL